MKVGDKVKVTNVGNIYSSYDVMFTKLGFINKKHNPAPVYVGNVEWEIKNIVEHPREKVQLLHLDYKGCEILIDKGGCELMENEIVEKPKFEIVGKQTWLNLEVPITVGDLEVLAIMTIIIYLDKDEIKSYDTEWVDCGYTKTRGVEITEWPKFIKFHKEMGIDYNQLIQEQIDLILSKEVVENLIKDINVNMKLCYTLRVMDVKY